MTPLMQLIERYGQAVADTYDVRKSHAVSAASANLADNLLNLIRMRVNILEKDAP